MNPLRTAALATALLSLAVIGIRPRWRVGATAQDAVLVTPGADAAAGEQLADSLGGAPVFASLADVSTHRAGLRRLHVVGWGLDADDWATIDSIPATFHPAAVSQAFQRASWPAQVVLGERISIDGVIARSRGPSAPRVELVDVTGVVDSTVFDSAGTFHLEAEPRALGHLLYTVRVRGTVIAETLGVEVLPPPAWRVLILESAPRPEATTLRDWLARRHGVVAVRSTVSRDRVHREFVNRAGTSLDVVSGALLSQFDIVAIDGRTLAALGSRERADLRRAVERDGLGVLIVPDTVVTDAGTLRFSDRDFFLDFALQHTGNTDERLVRPAWRDRGGREQRAPAVAAEPYTLADGFGVGTLISDGFGRALAQLAPRGAGRVTLSLITGTARWHRSGLADRYAAYWSRLLAATAASNRDAPRWSIATPGPWIVGRPVAIEAETERTLTTALVTGPAGRIDTVFLARDSAASGRWRGIFWPRTPGWYGVAGDGTPAFYAQSAASWVGVRANARIAATQRALVGAEQGERATTGKLIVPPHPVPLGWAFALFLSSAGYLWSERRRIARAVGSPADTAT
ncbi:MAG TPA: hypothetical protein VL563_10635 [Gemmatimonadales bacterium]|jgi:hypothetical protein|nr:hypothetical protein [Gemmatimonadales bacterium]